MVPGTLYIGFSYLPVNDLYASFASPMELTSRKKLRFSVGIVSFVISMT